MNKRLRKKVAKNEIIKRGCNWSHFSNDFIRGKYRFIGKSRGFIMIVSESAIECAWQDYSEMMGR
jgi:hypothetical protein